MRVSSGNFGVESKIPRLGWIDFMYWLILPAHHHQQPEETIQELIDFWILKAMAWMSVVVFRKQKQSHPQPQPLPM